METSAAYQAFVANDDEDFEDGSLSKNTVITTKSMPRLMERRRSETIVAQRVDALLAARTYCEPPTFMELVFPPTKDAYASNVLAGLVSGLKVCLGMVVFANIVFNTSHDESINAMFPIGINLNLIAASLALFWSSAFSDMNALVAPQDVPAMLLGQLSLVIARTVKDPSKAGHTVLAAGFITTILTGVVLLLLGRFNAGDTLRKIPAPVIGGFISAMGVIGIRTSLNSITGAPFYILWPTDFTVFHDWKTWAQLGLAFYSLVSIRYLGGWLKPYIKSKAWQAMISPICLLSPIFVFYVVLLCRGSFSEDLAWTRKVGWMYPAIHYQPFYEVWTETYRPDLVEWQTLRNHEVASNIAVIAGLTVLSAVLSIVGTAPCVPVASNLGGLGGRVDLDKELQVIGHGQLLVGALTGLPGYTQTALSANMYIFGGTHRLAEFVATGFVVLVMTSGIPVAQFIPKFFLGAVFFNLGLSFCKTHLIDNWGLMGRTSYVCMLSIVFVGLAVDLTKAVFVGLVICFFMMVKQASNINPVYQCGGSDGGFISARVRTMEEARRLRSTCGGDSADSLVRKLEVVRLQGPIFFGNAPTLEDDLESLLRCSPKLSHLCLDMTRVTQVDDSGARALRSVLLAARAVGSLKRFAVAGIASQELAVHLLSAAGSKPDVEFFPSLEDCLEVFEDDLLVDRNGGQEDPQQWKKPGGLTEEQWASVRAASSQELNLQDGELVCDFCRKVDGIWVLVRGSVAVETQRATVEKGQTSVEVSTKYSAPMPIGYSTYLVGATYYSFRVRVRGESGATVLHLTEADLNGLQEREPCTYIAFLKNFLSYWASVESLYFHWRSVLNQ